MNMFNQNELLLMIGVVGTLLVIISVLTIFDIIDYVKKKKSIVENNIVNENVENAKEQIQKVEVLEVNDNDEIHISDISKEDLNEDVLIEEFDDEPVLIPKKEEVINPIINLDSEIKVEKINPENEEISIQKELDKALNTIPNEEDAITKFEEEQERTAIISLDELKKKTDELYNNNEIVQYDDGDEPISINEIMKRANKQEEKFVPEEMEDIIKEKEVYTHKETMPFISSVYGIEKSNNSLEFENTATYEKLSKDNNDFMRRLREINENK